MVVGFAALGTVTAVFSLQDTDSGTTNDNGWIKGHVELLVLDEFGNVKQYAQGDNLVVTEGVQAASDLILGTALSTNPGIMDTVIVGTGGDAETAGDDLTSITQRSNRLQDDIVSPAAGSDGGIVTVIWDGANDVGVSGANGNDLNNATGAITINEVGLTTGGCGTGGSTQACSNSTAFPLFAYKASGASISVSIGQNANSYSFRKIETENEVPQGNLIKLNLTERIGVGAFP